MAAVKCTLGVVGLMLVLCMSQCCVQAGRRGKKREPPLKYMCPSKREWKSFKSGESIKVDLASDDLQQACDTVLQGPGAGVDGSRQAQRRARESLVQRIQEIGNLNLSATYSKHRHLPKCDVQALSPRNLKKVHRCLGTDPVQLPRKLSKVSRQRALELIIEIPQAIYSHTEYIYGRDLERSQEEVWDSHVPHLKTLRQELASLLGLAAQYVSVSAARHGLQPTCRSDVPVSELFLSVNRLKKQHRECQMYVFLNNVERLLQNVRTLVNTVDRSAHKQGKRGNKRQNKGKKARKNKV